MPTNQQVPVKSLKLDLGNYRTVKQIDEKTAIEAIIAVNPDWFWALTESLLETGYLPTENIIIQSDESTRPKLTVKEGNRRISALKLILGVYPHEKYLTPGNIASKINQLTPKWKRENFKVPCVIYDSGESDTVNRIQSLTHGKGERAGRDAWNPVARARHNRDENGASEPALDLLEKYLKEGKNHTSQQAQRWAGEFRLSVLEEAMKRLAPRLEVKNSPELAKAYPNISQKSALDEIILNIGLENITFDSLRKRDIASEYGIAVAQIDKESSRSSAKASKSADPAGNGSSSGANGATNKKNGPEGSRAAGGKDNAAANAVPKRLAAVAIQDVRQVSRTLKAFSPKGKYREKLVSLLIEVKLLKLKTHPIAFCFLLRSMFEVSAKAYCQDHKGDVPDPTDKSGRDRPLVDILRDITKHLTQNGANKEAARRLHGPMTEIARTDGILSVTSMNQLVHNPRFSHQPGDLAILFGNVFPLLEDMNS
ncbi:MAG TPA: hypothetical protein VLA61_11740 [Ideonella sp.]|uniref:hypothetical protein n=1 Tax=Ideonella sp. TaxID=1929293 RepID=UPI002BCAA078|nr:hypothetical protein [Ideonella sp.]HSI48936.1 hypothetical protein [Ideonella sp.]